MKQRILFLILLITTMGVYSQNVPATSPIVRSITRVAYAVPPTLTPKVNEEYLDTDGFIYFWDGTSWEPRFSSAGIDWTTPVNANILPSSNDTWSIGASGNSFFDGYFNHVISDILTISQRSILRDITFNPVDPGVTTLINRSIFSDSNTGLLSYKRNNGVVGTFMLSGDNISNFINDSNYVFQGINTLSSTFNLTGANGTGLILNPSLNSTVLKGGSQAGGTLVQLILDANGIEATGLSDAEITAIGPGALITKGYADATYTGGGTAASTTYDPTGTNLIATNVQAGITELDSKIADVANNLSGTNSQVTTVATRQDSIVTVLGSQTTSAFSFDTKTANSTAVLADAQDNKVIFLDYDLEDYTIPSGVFASGNAIRIQSKGNGIARIKGGAGVSFAPWQGFQLDSIGRSITVARVGSATGPETWFPIDGYIKNLLSPAPLSSNPNPELITTYAAFTPLDNSTVVNTGSNDNQASGILSGTFASANALPNEYGVHNALRVSTTTSTSGRINYYIDNVTVGATYSVAILYRKVDGNGSTRAKMVSVESNVTFDFQTTSTDWLLGTGTFVPSATKVRFELYGNFGGTTDPGSSDYIISVKLQ